MDPIVETIAPFLPVEERNYLLSLSQSRREEICEIRLKAESPMVLTLRDGSVNCPLCPITLEQIRSMFRQLCGSSAYAFQRQIAQGYLPLTGGHRVGLIGTAVTDEHGQVTGMKDFRGFVFRIRRFIPVPVDMVRRRLVCRGMLCNFVAAGPPCSGKTTFLASLAASLSDGFPVAVIDERMELFPDPGRIPSGCDVLYGYPKADGILQALRTLAPRVIVCDEVGSEREAEAMADGFASGVAVLFSVHAGSLSDLVHRPAVRRLMHSGSLGCGVLLSREPVGRVNEIWDGDVIRDAYDRACGVVSVLSERRGNLCGGTDAATTAVETNGGSDPVSPPADSV